MLDRVLLDAGTLKPPHHNNNDQNNNRNNYHNNDRSKFWKNKNLTNDGANDSKRVQNVIAFNAPLTNFFNDQNQKYQNKGQNNNNNQNQYQSTQTPNQNQNQQQENQLYQGVTTPLV